MAWTPFDLPFLVEGTHHTALWEADLLNAYLDAVPTFTPSDLAEISSLRDRQRTVAEMTHSPDLSWMDGDVSMLIRDSAATIPQWSPEAAMPSPAGLIAFEKTVMNCPVTSAASTAETAKVDAVCWWTTPEDRVELLVLSRTAVPGFNRELMARTAPMFDTNPPTHAALSEIFRVTLNIHAIQDASLIGEVASRVDTLDGHQDLEAFGSSTHELLCLMGATWLLMSQPRIVEEDTPAQVNIRKPTATPGAPRVRQKVQVSVRRLSAASRTAARAGSGGQAQSRWWVRGHWRQQAWGPGRTLRRPVFIEPHTAGARQAPEPDGALEPRPNVQVWRE